MTALKELKVDSAQVTVDGSKDTHNGRRPFDKGIGSYDLIMENVANAVENGFQIHIRVNIDDENPFSYENVLDDLVNLGLRNKVTVGTAITRSVGDSCKKVSDKLLDDNLFNFYKACLDKKFYSSIKFPKPYTGFCMMLSKKNFNIAPNGTIVPCLEEIGDPTACQPLGSIFDVDFDEKLDKFINNSNWVVEIDPCCKDCKVLPLCMCGCPKERLGRSKFGMPNKCVPFKHNLERMVRFLGDAKFNELYPNGLPIPGVELASTT